jgi:macrodomain Ter protein organizer (MatP/YcbG family)
MFNARKRKQLDKLIYLIEKKRAGHALVEAFNDKNELHRVIQMMRKNSHVVRMLQTWVNTHPAAAKEIEPDDVQYIINYFSMKSVHES